jgi:hypothetical protein
MGSLVAPAGAALVVQYKADAGVLNASGSPATVGEAVATWQDQSGNANPATNATGGDTRPTLQSVNTVAGLNKPVVRFDGTNDFLKSLALVGGFGTNDSLTMFAVVAYQGNPTGGRRFLGRDTYTGDFDSFLAFQGNSGNKYSAMEGQAGVSAAIADDGACTVGRYLVMTGVFDGGSHQVSLYMDGVLMNTKAYCGGEAVANRALTLGAMFWQGGWQNTAQADLAEVRLYGGSMSSSERAAIESQLYRRWLFLPPKGTIFSGH